MATVSRSTFSTRDPEEAIPALEMIYPNVQLGPQDRDVFRFDIDSVDSGLINTVRYRMTSPKSTGSIDTTGTLTIAHALGGAVRMEQGRTVLDTGKPWLFPQTPTTGFWDDVHVGAIALNLREVERFAHRVAGTDSFRLAFTGANPVTPALSRFWGATVRTLNRDLLRDDEAMASPLVHRAAFDQITLALLTAFPNTVLDLERSASGRAVPASVRRAKTFIDEHLAAPIALADIAEASGLSIRGLTAAFRRELDSTPMGYLKTGRLAAAHQDLLRTGPASGITISMIARRWGFGNAARFAAGYRDQFGVLPSVTFRS